MFLVVLPCLACVIVGAWQELPDWRGANTANGRLTTDAHATVASRLRNLHTRKQAGNFIQKVRCIKQTGLANKYHVMGCDHAFQGGLGFEGLSVFRPTSVLQPLRITEQRYFVDLNLLPDEIQRCSPGPHSEGWHKVVGLICSPLRCAAMLHGTEVGGCLSNRHLFERYPTPLGQQCGGTWGR